MKSQGILITAILALSMSGCSETSEKQTESVAPPAPDNMAGESAAQVSQQAGGAVDYDSPESWLCRPGRDDYCAIDLTTTIIESDGTTSVESFNIDTDAPIDCFYVYPTVSMDRTPNSDLKPGPGEINVIRSQFARFGAVCRTFAPLYRQVTLTALRARIAGEQMQVDRQLGYNDVKAAWDHYLENDNNNRGVILIGHSQGSGVLTQLIANEIDGKPVQGKVISAMLIGTRLSVPEDGSTGGTFEHMPLCTSTDQTGCAISYASFRDDIPPPLDSRFGQVTEEGMIAACTNPASLGGGRGELHAYMSSQGSGPSAVPPAPWIDTGGQVDTPFVSLPGMLTAECVNNERGSYLAVTVHGNPDDPRVDDIVGDVVTDSEVQASWGLHLIDMNLAMGNLIDIARRQGQAWLEQSSD